MINFLQRIKDPKLSKIVDSVPLGDTQRFKEILETFPEYDPSFLWLLCYSKEGMSENRNYIEAKYENFRQVLDSNFPKIFASRGNFDARMWELILCDVLVESGELIPKNARGADFLLKTPDDQIIQIEAVTPNEAEDENLRSIRPIYDKSNFFEHGGNIEDMERPVLLRVFDKGFIQKAERKQYESDKPLIIAINSSKVVGLTSLDPYVLRRLLFGLGFNTITKLRDDSHVNGLQQNLLLNKPGKESFEVAVFRSPEYKHVSGVLYTSQSSLGFIPGGYSWYNYGMTFVPNPIAKNPVNVQFPFFRKILCTNELYQEIDAEKQFVGN